MSQRRQEELSRLLKKVLSLDPVAQMKPEPRLCRIHYDWLKAGEHTQRTVAQLSQQLRRFLDDQAWLENRRIMEILHEIEANALAVREALPPGAFMEMADRAAPIDLPMERPLYRPPIKPLIADVELEAGQADLDAAALFAQVVVDREALVRHIRNLLQTRTQISLEELVAARPLRQGLVELIAYLQIAGGWPETVVDEQTTEVIEWQSEKTAIRRARLPRIIFVRN